MSGEGSKKKINRKLFILYFSPVLLMVVAIIVLSVRERDTGLPQPTVTQTAVPTQAIAAATTATRAPILPATVLPSPTPTATLLPDVPANATITLLGPPPDSSVPNNGRIAFYWMYNEPLLPRQEFVLILRQNDEILAASALQQPNLGSGYQVSLDSSDLGALGTAVWQIQLRWQGENTPLLASEARSLVLLP